jgi:hypothetical protein
MRLFGDLNATGGTEGLLQVTVDGELTGGQGTDHEETGTDTAEGALEAELLGDLDQAGGGALTGKTLGLVDLGEHGVGRLGDDGGGETGNQTGAQVGNGLLAVGEGLLGELLEDELGNLLKGNELGHGIGNLLEENGAETSVESTDTLVLEHLGEATDETVGVGGLRDETDTGGLERAEGNVGEELGGTGRGKVDGGTVVGGSLVAELVDALLLEELVTTELQGTLEEVTGKGRAGTGEQSTSTLILDDLAEAADETAVVGDGVELDTGLDDIDGGETTVGDGAADGTGKGETRVEGQAGRGSRVGSLGVLDSSLNLSGDSHCE